jgi:hypothetical protein
MGYPIQWMSKLETNIATSTMEAEYTALSIALRAAIPLLEVIRFVISAFSLNTAYVLRFKTTVHEDNQGALKLATLGPGRQTFYFDDLVIYPSDNSTITTTYIHSRRQ